MENKVPVSPNSTLLVRLLKSDAFWEKAFLLFITAALSGLIVPFVIKSVESAREKREALSHAQAKLFDDVSQTILTCETLMLDVSWFGTPKIHNPETQAKAFERYSERSVDLVVQWRVLSSRAQTLASPQISEKIDAFLLRFFSEQDTPMNRLWTECGTNCNWQALHLKNEAMLDEANKLIVELANDLGLARD